MARLHYRTPSLGRGIMLAAMSLGLVTLLLAGTGSLAFAGPDPGWRALDRMMAGEIVVVLERQSIFDDLFIVEGAPEGLPTFAPVPAERPHASAIRLSSDAGVIPLTGGAAIRAPPPAG